MIKIRSTENTSGPTLVQLEATLTTPLAVYEFSSAGPMFDSSKAETGTLFGAISWPQSRFRVEPGVTIEQQTFISHDTSDVAISWELKGRLIPIRLVVRPYFAGCATRSYRDAGFHRESTNGDGRLVWLPTVRGPRIVADTNGQYADEPLRSAGDMLRFQDGNAAESLIAPGRFEFDLSQQPSVLIFSHDGESNTEKQRMIGTFLANLMQRTPRRTGLAAASVASEPLVAV